MKTSAGYFIVVLGIACVYIANLFIDVMDVDASQYASMSFEMIQENQFLFFTDQHRNYLDKPPLIFWLSSTAYRLFGIANWSYKLPSLLFALLGIFSTFRFARLYYSLTAARLAALMLATTQAMFLMTNDCRTDTVLMGAVAFSLWQLGAYLQGRKTAHFVGAFVGIGLAMLAKGPIGLMMPLFAFGPHLLLKSWRDIFRPQWLLGLLIVAAILTPMCVGLYLQYDANPEAVVNGQKGVSGLYFFFWKQSFGRITGESEWNNGSDPFFFLHTFAWTFLPWTLFAIGALGQRLRELIRKGPAALEEIASLTGFMLPWMAFSLSHYKLPHYIFVFFPMAAVLTAQYTVRVFQEKPKTANILLISQLVMLLLLWGVPVILTTYVFPVRSLLPVVLAGLLFGAFLLLLMTLRKQPIPVLSISSALTMAGINIVLSLHFYPQTLEYQSGSVAGKYIKKQKWGIEEFLCYKTAPHSLDFYSQRINNGINSVKEAEDILKKRSELYLYGTPTELREFRTAGYRVQEILFIPHYAVSRLNVGFFNPETRKSGADSTLIVKITRP